MEDGDEDAEQWLFPVLRWGGAAEKIGGYSKALLPAPDGVVRFNAFALRGMPARVTGKSIRVSVSDELSCKVPVEHGAALTGHDVLNLSSFYEYMRFKIGRYTAGAAVLAGYPAPQWETTGVGPRGTNVAALQTYGIDTTPMALVHLALDVLRLEIASPPALLPRGEFIRPPRSRASLKAGGGRSLLAASRPW